MGRFSHITRANMCGLSAHSFRPALQPFTIAMATIVASSLSRRTVQCRDALARRDRLIESCVVDAVHGALDQIVQVLGRTSCGSDRARGGCRRQALMESTVSCRERAGSAISARPAFMDDVKASSSSPMPEAPGAVTCGIVGKERRLRVHYLLKLMEATPPFRIGRPIVQPAQPRCSGHRTM